MSNSDIAIIISIFSVLVASFSLGWNIYRDVILKPRVKVDFGVKTIVQQGNPKRPGYVVLTATNHGPGIVNLSMVQMADTSLIKRMLGKRKYAVVIHDYTNPLSGQLPHKLEVGEKIDLLFPYNKECILKEGWSHIGINDSFGRVHWVRSKQVKEAITKWRQDFTGVA